MGKRRQPLGKRLRRQAAILWRFRYHFLSAVGAWMLWNTTLIKPFRVFVVMVHEVCHATASLLTGGQVIEMHTAWEESGHTLTMGGWPPVIISAGYVGSALIGALLIGSGIVPQLQRLLVLLVGAVTMGMTMAYTPVGGVGFYLGILGGLALVCLAMYSAGAGAACAVWLGVMLCMYSLHDFRTDLWQFAEYTDAGILAEYWGLPWLAYPIAAIWVWFSAWMMYRAMGTMMKYESNR
ncbi:MAG: M50 family metallopeptidase [bacterium]|nr:M50 family metallopeptidase [bacterium]